MTLKLLYWLLTSHSAIETPDLIKEQKNEDNSLTATVHILPMILFRGIKYDSSTKYHTQDRKKLKTYNNLTTSLCILFVLDQYVMYRMVLSLDVDQLFINRSAHPSRLLQHRLATPSMSCITAETCKGISTKRDA